MSERYFQVSNFKWGLDGRRSELLEQPGALVQCDNAHINDGGEIEQRKSFAKQAGSFPATTFGFEATQSGLVVFGSTASPGALPTGVSYRQCVHPTGFKVGGAAASMTNVLSSCNFNGLAFVLAQFDDGNTFGFYGDVSPMPLVMEVMKNGDVLYVAAGAETLANIATDLTAILNGVTGFTATANVDQNGTTINGDVVLLTTPGLHLAFTPTDTSTLGVLQTKLIDQNSPTISQQASVVGFFLTGGAAGSITLTVGATAISGTVNYATSLTATASALASAVNAKTPTTGYSALATGTNVHVYAPLSLGASGNALVLTVTVVTLTVSTIVAPFTAQMTVNGVVVSIAAIRTVVPTTFSIQTTGATGGITYAWSIISSAQDAFGITPSGASCSVSALRGVGPQGTVQCIVTDGGSGSSVTTQTAIFTSN